MRYAKHFLLTAAMMLCSLTVSAHDFAVGGIYYKITSTSDLTVAVTYKGRSYSEYSNEYSGSIAIPEEVTYSNKSYRVTSIGNRAFSSCSYSLSVTIPNTVTTIEPEAFWACGGLKDISLGEGVTSIGSRAFQSTGLVSIVIPNQVISLGFEAFRGCSSLTTVVIGDGVPSLGNYVFSGCSKLTSIKIGNSVTSIGSYALDGCKSLDSIVFPDCVNSIGSYALYGCTGLTSLIVGNGVSGIGNFAFSGCNSLVSTVIPASVSTIGESAFRNCTGELFVNCDIPSASSATGGAFCGSKYNKVIFGDEVSSIGDYAFYGCSNLTAMEMSNGVNTIGIRSFESCSGLTSVYIGKSVTSIGEYAFYDCVGLQSTIISENVTSLGNGAFYGCSGALLINCNIPTSAFSESKFSQVEIGGKCQMIGDEAFRNNQEMKTLVLNEGIKEIGARAFSGCSGLIGDLLLPESLISIGEYAFCNCTGFDGVLYIGGNVKDIKNNAFTRSVTTGNSYKKTIHYFLNFTEVISRSLTPASAIAPNNSTLDLEQLILDYYWGTFGYYTIESDICTLKVPLGSKSLYEVAPGWKQFANIVEVEMDEVERDVEILDSWEDFGNTEDKDCNSITYTRTFNNTNWQALYVPFEIPITAEFLADFEVAYINNVHQRDYDDDGVTEHTEVEAFKITKGTLRANYPYLIRAKEAGKKIITVTNTTLYVTEENSIDCASVFRTYTFTGTYKRLSSDVLPQSEGYYALSGGKWKPIATGSSLGAFRFYLQVKSRGGDAATKALSIRMRIFDEYGNEEITEVEEVEANLPAEDVVYDLQGRRVEVPGKGVYIVNGKKMVF